jgi:hypothetical protein
MMVKTSKEVRSLSGRRGERRREKGGEEEG